jgi:hypothetical protein
MISCVHYATEEENSQWNTGETKLGKTGTSMENGGSDAGHLPVTIGTAALMLAQGDA